MKKSLYVFLQPTDEANLSTALRQLVPGIRFVDGTRWATPEPPLAASIEACRGRSVLLWDPALVPQLPSRRDHDGVHHLGPRTAVVGAIGRAAAPAHVTVRRGHSWFVSRDRSGQPVPRGRGRSHRPNAVHRWRRPPTIPSPDLALTRTLPAGKPHRPDDESGGPLP